jgi:hypothetical protein
VDFPGYQYSAGIAKGLQPCGYVDAFAIDVAAILNDDITEVETDPYPKWTGIVAQIALNGDCAPQGRDWAGEFSQKAIARGLDQPSLLLGKARLDDLAPQPADASIGTLLVALHQRRKANDVRGQNGRQFPLNGLVDQTVPPFKYRRMKPCR